MIPKGILLIISTAVIVGTISFTIRGAPKAVVQSRPKLVPVADTRLIMEGLALANFRGLEKLLKEKPASKEAWTFARGQALLIAETGNLLMLRPPRNQGEKIWLDRALSLRQRAAELARSLAQRNFATSRKMLAAVASSCNSCHQRFRVETRIRPFAQDNDDQEGQVRHSQRRVQK